MAKQPPRPDSPPGCPTPGRPSDGNSDEGASGPTAADRQFQKLVCPICGAVLIGVHCKLICENCGYREDCSDLF